jgi:hypothetical protein
MPGGRPSARRPASGTRDINLYSLLPRSDYPPVGASGLGRGRPGRSASGAPSDQDTQVVCRGVGAYLPGRLLRLHDPVEDGFPGSGYFQWHGMGRLGTDRAASPGAHAAGRGWRRVAGRGTLLRRV